MKSRFWKFVIGFFGVLLLALTGAWAEEVSPVTGHIEDPLTIFVNRFGSQSPNNKVSLLLTFCDSKTTLVTPTSTTNHCVSPTRPLKLAGKLAQGVKIEPEIKGEWRFTWEYALQFTPSEPWKAGQRYHVSFEPGLFPSFVKLTDQGYDFTAAQLYLTSKDLNYLQDPSDPAKKMVTAQLSFNYPVQRDSVKAALGFAWEGVKGPLPFTVDFDDEDTHANVTVPVKELKENAQFMTLAVAQSVKTAGGGATLASRNTANEFNQRVMVPSLYDYLQFTNAQTRVLKNSHYVPQQMLALETNTPVNPTELAASLEIKLLPKDKPIPNLSPKKDYAWSSPTEITPELRATLEAVPYELDKTGEPSLVNAVTLHADGNRFALITVKKGMPAPGGYKLGKDYETITRIPAFPKEVSIMAQGALLSLSGEKKLSFVSLGVSGLSFDIARVKEEHLNHLISQTNGNFASPQFAESYAFNEENISTIFHEDRPIDNADPKTPSYSALDLAPYIGTSKGIFLLTVNGTNKDPKQESASSAHSKKRPVSYDGSDRRFILVTDMGIIAKQNSDQSWDVFVQSIANGNPMRGVQVQVLGKNGEPVAESVTDGMGHAKIPSMSEQTRERTPVAFVASTDDDLSFLPYNKHDREVNYSRFDVEGNVAREGMRAYLFNDRGIYRPGETAHIGIIVKNRDWSRMPYGLPLVLEVTNPRGQVVQKEKLALSEEGIISADFATRDTATTGMYNAALYLGRDNGEKGAELGNVALRVEEFQPDRMKITSALLQNSKPIEGLAWVKPEQLGADITLMHLYGAPASDRRVTGKMMIAPGGFGFESYRDYQFTPEGSVNKTFDETLTETKTNEEGKAHFDINLAKYGKSTFRLNLLAEGFEPDSGRSVKTAKTVLVSPLDYVLGVKSNGNLSYITQGDARALSFIAVNNALKSVDASDLTAELKRVKDVQTLTKDGQGNYRYTTAQIETSLNTAPLQVKENGSQYPLPTDKPGSFVLVVRNAGGVTLARERFTVVGEANASADYTRDATMQVLLDKSSYKSGEEITLNIQSPYTGTGLITIETDHVHTWKWFKAEGSSTTQKITIPTDFEGKGFVNVQFTRDLKSKDIFMSPFSFAVVPFTANVEAHDQHVSLSASPEVKPGEQVTVHYQSKEPGKIVLYAVDEGILQYAHYQNPDPLDYFLLKRGLEVRTLQIMDLLMPEYSLLRQLSNVGGDGSANDGKNLNPFKRKTQPPVAYWSGILESGPEQKDWTFTVPPYFNGKVRIVAVSVSFMAMGTTQTSVNVKAPLIVTPNLPLFVAPGDSFLASATVANYVKGSGAQAKVKIDVTTTPHLQVLDAPKEPLVIAEGKEIVVPLHMKATETLGSGELQLVANLDAEHFTITQTTSVRPPLTAFTALQSGYTQDKSKTVAQPRVLFPELSQMQASVSSLPVSLIGGLKDYLEKYPYGCTEQLTSQNFPNVILYGNTELMEAFGWKSEDMERALRVSFDELRERQSSGGGWGMWNYYSESQPFVSTYVMHFLLEAKEKNLPVPEDVFQMGLRRLKQTVNEEPTSLENAREKAYGLYVLTRSGEVTSNYIPHLLTYLDNNEATRWHDDLVAVYLAATYQQMQMQPEADKLLDAFHLATPVYYTTSWHDYAFYDSLTKYSQYVYLIAKHFPKRLEVMDKQVIWRVANFVGEGSYNTVSSSYAVMAVDAYVTARKDALAGVTISAKGADGKEQMLQVLGQRLKVAKLQSPVSEFTFGSESPGFFYQIASSGYDKALPDKPVMAGIELKREYSDAEGKPVTQAKLGDVVTVAITLRSGSNESLANVAVVDLLPGGFELEPEAKATATEDKSAATGDKPLWQPESVDRREDRIILYGTAVPAEYVYRYKMKAASRGQFVVPPPYAESMYDPALKARGLAGRIEVQ